MTGCAYPVRNFTFDLLQLGLKNNFYKKKSWILNIDSDDELYDEYSLVQIMKLAKKSIYTKGGVSMAHGYAVWETYDENFRPIRSSCPAYVDSKFPEVKKMADIYERGLIFLAAIIPSSTMQWLRYPSEFSFEDDALNQKLMLTAMKKNQPWIYTDYPIILKGYSGDTMINRNNQLGDPKLEAVIGIGHKVTGIRAVIVNHLRTLRDYYVINDL